MAYSKTAPPNPNIPQEVITDYLEGVSSVRLAKKYGMAKCKILNFLRASGIGRRSRSESKILYACNYDYFKQIDTADKSYWLGFLYADGNIYHNKMQLRLGTKDKQHLELFKSHLQSDHPIFPDNKCYGLAIVNEKMRNDLVKLGCVPNKTFQLKLPKLSPKLMSHFLRGYFDGDGTVYTKNRLLRSAFSGTKYICERLWENFKKTTRLQIGGIYKEKRRTSDCWTLAIATTNSLNINKIYQWLYQDCGVCLARKHDRFLKRLEQI